MLQKREGVYIRLLQEYYILKRWRKGSKRNRKGMKKKETTQTRTRKARTVWVREWFMVG